MTDDSCQRGRPRSSGSTTNAKGAMRLRMANRMRVVEDGPMLVRFRKRSLNEREGALLQARITHMPEAGHRRYGILTNLLTAALRVTIVPRHERPFGDLRHLPGDYRLASPWPPPSFLAPRRKDAPPAGPGPISAQPTPDLRGQGIR